MPIETSSTLSEDGLSVTYTKVFFDEETGNYQVIPHNSSSYSENDNEKET